MNAETTPIEASLLWAISKSRRADGARAGGFPGAAQIFAQQQSGVARKRVGLLPQERTPVREGAEIVDADGNRHRHRVQRRLWSDLRRTIGHGQS